ncbi:hypothetical protein BDV23DRAFT_161483 [Aspergillus alliaceus]|uniref:Uncharacterized protein n=1 Tax=Petromyces alliaceus TaxID=209559 RepID=A0A5N7BZR7_PETAA|nr:hypothetical protein BDV23DRAFT_161483 [Aspergillus alliaceus]
MTSTKLVFFPSCQICMQSKINVLILFPFSFISFLFVSLSLRQSSSYRSEILHQCVLADHLIPLNHGNVTLALLALKGSLAKCSRREGQDT